MHGSGLRAQRVQSAMACFKPQPLNPQLPPPAGSNDIRPPMQPRHPGKSPGAFSALSVPCQRLVSANKSAPVSVLFHCFFSAFSAPFPVPGQCFSSAFSGTCSVGLFPHLRVHFVVQVRDVCSGAALHRRRAQRAALRLPLPNAGMQRGKAG